MVHLNDHFWCTPPPCSLQNVFSEYLTWSSCDAFLECCWHAQLNFLVYHSFHLVSTTTCCSQIIFKTLRPSSVRQFLQHWYCHLKVLDSYLSVARNQFLCFLFFCPSSLFLLCAVMWVPSFLQMYNFSIHYWLSTYLTIWGSYKISLSLHTCKAWPVLIILMTVSSRFWVPRKFLKNGSQNFE